MNFNKYKPVRVLPVSIVQAGDCEYNGGVACWNREKCYCCGWNPRVLERRKFTVRYYWLSKWQKERGEMENGMECT